MTEKFVTDVELKKILADFPKKKNSAYNLDFNQIASYIIGYGSIAQRPFASQERMNAVFVEKAVISSSVTVHRLWQCIAKNWVMIASTDGSDIYRDNGKDVLIDGGTFLAPSDNTLIDGGSFL